VWRGQAITTYATRSPGKSYQLSAISYQLKRRTADSGSHNGIIARLLASQSTGADAHAVECRYLRATERLRPLRALRLERRIAIA
jgi:hypothetical protein